MSARKHEQAALDRLRAAARSPSSGLAIAADDAVADLLMANDIIEGIRSAGSLLLAVEAIAEQAEAVAKSLRTALAEVMGDTGAVTVDLAHHTLALVEPKPRPVVLDAAALPAEFLIPQPPKPDMAAITRAAKAGPVAGVIMNNAAPHLRISAKRDRAA